MKHQFLSTFISIIFLDQFTKYLATQASISQLNRGISLGLISANNQIVLTTVLIFVMLALWLSQKKLWQKYPVVSGLLFGGAVSNIVDRVLFKGVIDWLPVPGFNLVNNIGDWSISLALAAILLLELRSYRAKLRKKDVNEN